LAVILGEFLREKGLTLRGFSEKLHSAVGARRGDVLLAVGSIVEGLGNSHSDLDVYVVPSRRSTQFRRMQSAAYVVGSLVVDAQILHRHSVAALISRLYVWLQRATSEFPAPFDAAERLVFHRLLTGRLLLQISERALSGLRPTMGAVIELKSRVARHLGRTVQIDMAGFHERRDWQSLVFSGQELLGHGIDAVLAMAALTNPTPKWRPALLRSLHQHGGSDISWIGVRPSTLARVFWELHRAPARATSQTATAHALRILGFTRAVFAALDLRLARIPRPHPQFPCLRTTRMPAAGFPALGLDVDLRIAPGRVSTTVT
jgi:hypothetical protein